jgi:hypothetical protein
MKHPKGVPCHECAPKEMRHTPNITGLPTVDRFIRANPNKDMVNKLKFYAGVQAGIHRSHSGYGYRTNYDGYDGYSGDE